MLIIEYKRLVQDIYSRFFKHFNTNISSMMKLSLMKQNNLNEKNI